MGGWIGYKVLLFGNLFLLIDVSKLFQSINTSKRLYFLLSVRSKSILFMNLKALMTRELLIYASC